MEDAQGSDEFSKLYHPVTFRVKQIEDLWKQNQTNIFLRKEKTNWIIVVNLMVFLFLVLFLLK